MTHEEGAALWYRALEAELGLYIEVEPENFHAVKNALLRIRVKLEDERLSVLCLHCHVDMKSLWIYRRPEAKLD